MFLPEQSESEPMWTFKVRWRAILTPVCLLLGHDEEYVQGVFAFDRSYERCRRCLKVLWEAKHDRSSWLVADSEGEAVPSQKL